MIPFPKRFKTKFSYDMLGLWSFIFYPGMELMIVSNEEKGTTVFIWFNDLCELVVLE